MPKERLTEDRKLQIEQIYKDLRRHNFYTVLGVDSGACRTDIRAAYFAISKLCHPDNYVEDDLGEHKMYMEKVFQACSKAYDVLSNARKRGRYDEYLAKKADTAEYATNVLRQHPESGVGEPAQETGSSTSMPPASTAVGQGEIPMPAGPFPVQGVAGQARQTLFTSQASRPVPQSAPDSCRIEAHESRRREWRQSSAKRGLLGVIGNVKAQERFQRGQSWVVKAQKALEEGEVLNSLNALRMAVNLDSENAEAKKLLDEVMLSASGELALRYVEQARAELDFGEKQLAQASIMKALEFSPTRPDLLATAARVLLETDGDMHRAYECAQRASQADPKSARNMLLMGKILLKAGLDMRARSVLARAVEMDPKLEEAREILARL